MCLWINGLCWVCSDVVFMGVGCSVGCAVSVERNMRKWLPNRFINRCVDNFLLCINVLPQLSTISTGCAAYPVVMVRLGLLFLLITPVHNGYKRSYQHLC